MLTLALNVIVFVSILAFRDYLALPFSRLVAASAVGAGVFVFFLGGGAEVEVVAGI